MKTSPHVLQQRILTPLGWLSAARSQHGLTGLWFDGQKHHPSEIAVPVVEGDPLLSRVDAALQAYFKGQPLPAEVLRTLEPQGTAFQQEVWRALLQIAPGGSLSYGALARRLGRPRAVRAVGAAVGRNPISILIPCHRVLGAAGGLTGYAGGIERKKALLDLEGATYKP